MPTEKNYRAAFENNMRTQPPRTEDELEHLLAAVHDHSREIKGWKTNPATNVIEPDLGTHNGDQLPPFYLVPKHGKTSLLHQKLNNLLVESQGGFAPSNAVVHEVWDMLDLSASIR